MTFNDSNLIIILVVAFAIIGAVGSVIYYFARYYVKTGADDKEVFIKPKELTVGEALRSTRENFWGRLGQLTNGEITGPIRDQIEEVLITSDLGPRTADELLQTIEDQLSRAEKGRTDAVKGAVRARMQAMLDEAQSRRD